MAQPDAGDPAVRRVVIVGAGGFGREVLQYVRDTFGGDDRVVVKGFIDDAPPDLTPFGLGVPVLGDTRTYQPEPDDRFLLAIGDTRTRRRLVEELTARGARFMTVVHPQSYVSRAATVGVGCIIAPYATVGAHATIGDHTVLTFCASVGHDSRVGSYCVFSPHAVTNGVTRIGDGVFLGAHAVIAPLKGVGDWSKVAASSVVYVPVPPGMLAAGNPAKPRPLW